jgi:K+-transporting ATPase ATPase B chain
MSGIDIDGRIIRKGAVDAIANYLEKLGNPMPKEVRDTVEEVARTGGTPLVVAENNRALGVIHLKDIVKGGMRERFEQLRAMGIRTIMITGDNPLTAAAIAREAGVDDFLAEAKPKDKMDLIRREQAQGNDGRWHQRCSRAGSSRRWCGDELGNPGGERGRQHGGPGLEPNQAH